MTHLEQAITDAIEKGGWKNDFYNLLAERKEEIVEIALLDPAFWHALGKARGWADTVDYPVETVTTGKKEMVSTKECLYHHHRLIDALHEADAKGMEQGEAIELFFKELA